jgi:hypothetical protein
MTPIEEALAAIESREPGDDLVYQEYADWFGVNRVTLARRHQGRQGSRATQIFNQKKLTLQQEEELVLYIGDLAKRGLPPTNAMIRNFASTIAHERVSEAWVVRFKHRHHNTLVSKWGTAMDATRHAADSYIKYKLYFNLLHGKMEEHKILPCNSYNMDEKGFMIGVIGRSKRVFTRSQWERKEVTVALQDGSRKWITTIAAICADGSSLPPGLIYESANCTIQSSWVADIKPGIHDVFVASTPSGWTNNDVGLAWLEQVFDRCTKKKARNGRDWRLLILDGHGSHLTEDFLHYCLKRKIYVAVFPPHSTHTLQPLDVVCFKPLSSAYSKRLAEHTQQSQGLVPIKKGDFFLLFWDAWQSSFKKETIERSFAATGIWPMDRERVMKRFPPTTPNNPANKLEPTWREADRLIRASAGKSSSELRKVSSLIHHLANRNELLSDENEGLRMALSTKKKHNKKSKVLDLQQREEYHGGAVFWSPRKMREAQAREATNKRLAEEEKLQKVQMRDLKASNALYKKKLAAEKRAEREAKAEQRRLEREEKAAKRKREKQERNTKKPILTSQKGKRKALQPSALKAKRQKRSGDAAAPAEAVPAVPAKVARSGRTVKLPTRYL